MKPVLMIITSHDQLGSTGKQTGLWAEELTTAYYTLKDAGFSLELASPKGGKPPFASGSIKADVADNPPSVQRFLNDKSALDQFENTKKTAGLLALDYSAVFLPGGHGTMWDTAIDPATAQLVGQLFDANRPVAAVCHGPAGLVSALRSDGKSIVFGKQVNAFTNEEELAAGLTNVVPFALESRLKELGAFFKAGPMWQAFVVRDGNLITGQNPASTELVAHGLVELLTR
jgi:putative intracellular protease/amidase